MAAGDALRGSRGTDAAPLPNMALVNAVERPIVASLMYGCPGRLPGCRRPRGATAPGTAYGSSRRFFSRQDVATTLISAAFAGSGLLRSPCPDPAGEGEQAVLC
jgi:hypothetical protein